MSRRERNLISEVDIEEQMKYIQEVGKINRGKNLYYHIVTYGCQMNVHDSEKLAGLLLSMGYAYTENQDQADLILFNTCCVREHAELRVYGNIGALKSLKQNNPNLIIGVCGCMMQQKEVSEYILKRFPYVDMIFGTHNLHAFPEILFKAISSSHTILEVWEEGGEIIEDIPVQRKEGAMAWVTIMYGCNNFCTYCIVPHVRGRERSRKPQDIIEEVKSLVDQGYREVTLLGQNVNSYGKDLDNKLTFAMLLRELNKIERLYRIRFMTSHPKDLSDDLIDAMAECERVCDQLHLPVQSGSDDILKRMNRNYTIHHYIELVKKIRGRIPHIGFTTDIIIGFPGETEEDFEATLSLMEQIRFDSAYMFAYSKRTGTPASKMEEQVDEIVKKQRLDKLIKLQNSITKEINDTYKGRVLDVLVESVNKKDPNFVSGKTETGKVVSIPGTPLDIGMIIKVKITQVKAFTFVGERFDSIDQEENL